MATNRSSFAKLERDRNKSAKAAAKRERRQSKTDKPESDEVVEIPGEPGDELSAAELLKLVEQLHRQLDNEEISFEDFEERKADLMARIPVD